MTKLTNDVDCLSHSVDLKYNVTLYEACLSYTKTFSHEWKVETERRNRVKADAASLASAIKKEKKREEWFLRRRAVYVLRQEGLTFKEIAGNFGVSTSRARSLFERGQREYKAEQGKKDAAHD